MESFTNSIIRGFVVKTSSSIHKYFMIVSAGRNIVSIIVTISFGATLFTLRQVNSTLTY
jgi:hypothetical protein